MAINVTANPARLTWSSFRLVDSIPDSDEEAQVNPETSIPEMRIEHGRGQFRLASFTILVGLNQTNTMVVRTAEQTAELLEHEQGHYDLLIVGVRALAREMESLAAASTRDLGAQVQRVRDTHAARAEAIDAAYDRQTDHSRNGAEQTRWNGLIRAAMANPRAREISGMRL
jgi:hypothetical protein